MLNEKHSKQINPLLETNTVIFTSAFSNLYFLILKFNQII